MKSFNLAMETLFWASLCLIVYTYFVYPVVLFISYSLVQVRSDWRHLFGGKDRRVASLSEEAVPKISFIVPAYNEEDHLHQKLINLREMDYPRKKLQIIFVSDGSSDSTNEILKTLPDQNIETVILPARSGKATALNHAVLRAQHEILVFSDCSTLFAPGALRKLGRHFADVRIGAVCGALRFHASSTTQQTEGIYWKYECMMRMMEARLGATLTASGAIYALRREAYVPLNKSSVLDDFIIPMNARKAGYRIGYDPEAIATDYGSESVEGEFTRRVRLATGSFQSLFFLLRVKMGVFGRFAFVSHKLLRWILPLLLCILLISNAALVRNPTYAVFGLLQLFFYLWASLGYLFRKRLQGVRYALVGYYLLAMNLAFLVGLFRCLTNHSEATWQRVS
jgi:cellulose synthase/poly-beta-1,6-N-acetylglucosamine synthase-like glycosyltransferase